MIRAKYDSARGKIDARINRTGNVSGVDIPGMRNNQPDGFLTGFDRVKKCLNGSYQFVGLGWIKAA